MMKKWVVPVCLLGFACVAYAQQQTEKKVASANGSEAATQQSSVSQIGQLAKQSMTDPAALKKHFAARKKEIRKLVKHYKKASGDEKQQIKARLTQIVSDATDEGLAWAKERIASERANLNRWEQKIVEQEKDLDAVKAKRVEDILSGEAERRYKLAQKRWKLEMKDRKKEMK